MRVLRVDDPDHAQRAGHHDDADEHHGDGDLVADELRRRAQTGEQRKLAVRRIPREDDPVHANRRDRHDVKKADVDVGDDERTRWPKNVASRSKGMTANAIRAGTIATIGARVNTHLSARDRRDVFLQQQLDRVGDRLQRAVRPDPHRAEPDLHPRDDLPLEQRHERHRDQHRVQQDQNLEQRDEVGATISDRPRRRRCRSSR